MIKATTSHGTYYLIDEENNRAMRVKGEGRGSMDKDGDWFSFSSLDAIDYDSSPPRLCESYQIETGKGIYFFCVGVPGRLYDWRSTTRVTAIEEAENG